MAKSGQLLECLRRRHNEDEWLFAGEVRLLGFLNEQRLDALAVALWPSKKKLRHSYEIKVSRSDFLNEIKNPQKRQFALDNSEYFWFVTTDNIVKSGEIPEEAGHYIYNEEKDILKKVKQAPKRKVEPISSDLLMAISKRIRTETKRKNAENEEIVGYTNICNLLNQVSLLNPSLEHIAYQKYLLLTALRKKGHMKEALAIEKKLAEIGDRIKRENIDRLNFSLWKIKGEQ